MRREKKMKKKKWEKKKSADVQKCSKWLRWIVLGGRGGDGELFRIYCHIMQSVMKRLFAWETVDKTDGKDEKTKRWRFGIYNLAWRNTVTSRHQINLCKCPYISPVCPSMTPNHATTSPILRSCCCNPSPAHKQTEKKQINTCLCWLTEQAHVLQRRWNGNAQTEKKKRKRSTLSSF